MLGAEVLGDDDGDGWKVLPGFKGERLSRLTGDAVRDVEGTGWIAEGIGLAAATRLG